MKVSDYVFERLAEAGISEVFTVSGGGIAHLIDSMGRNPSFRYTCNHHEQACAVSAEGYARVTGKMAVCLVTLGPGAVNALAGIVGAWVDSIPMLVISGQVRSDLIADYSKLRQKGPQEANAIEMARPVTKYAASVRNPLHIRHELEKALHLATSGRPGPVWLELPFDVQGASVEKDLLEKFTPPEAASTKNLASDAALVWQAIRAAERPLIIGGNGIHLSGSRDLFLRFIEEFQIPVATPYTAKDVMAEAHPLNIGVFGTAGQRRANFAVQNADLIIALGAGLCVSKVGFNFAGFAPKARKVIVDVDRNQIEHQVPKADIAVVADVGRLLEELMRQRGDTDYRPTPRWLEVCAHWKQKYPIILDEYFEDRDYANMYVFMDRLSDALNSHDIMITGNGFDLAACYQAFKVQDGQRILLSGNWGSMGWDLPMAIGGCIGRGRQRAILVTGDGSVQFNIQELLTARHYGLPLKVFIFNNQGYSCIRSTQKSLFESRIVAADAGSGVGQMDFRKLADLYNFQYGRIDNNDDIVAGVQAMLAIEGPTLCEVKISPHAVITPKASAFRRADGTIESRPLEDMAPFLPREEIHENMHFFDETLSPTS
jgi:acetolactate synthase-1/2/3 large subunit